MDSYIAKTEERNGIRFSWHVCPSSDKDAAKLVVPVGCVYTPLKRYTIPPPEDNPDAPVAPLPPRISFEPVGCKSCRSILNPYCSVDFAAKLWTCPFCLTRNQIPSHYNDISPENRPTELYPDFTTIEYALPRPKTMPPLFLFVIDVTMESEELESLKESILMSLSLIPEDSLVGLITFGTTVQVYELACDILPKAYVFNGSTELSAAEVKTMLGLAAKGHVTPAITDSKFVRPYSSCEMHLESILEELQIDSRSVPTGERPLRATGVALSIATSLMETTVNPGRIMLFASGPCTQGPGKIVSHSQKEILRAHHDLLKDEAPLVEPATKFYDTLASRIAASGHVVDIFSGTLHQVGILEMGSLLKKTGGLSVISDTFADDMFKKSYARIFNKDDRDGLDMAFNATIEVKVSKEFKILGCIGHVAGLNQKSNTVSENTIGVGKTKAWRVTGLDTNTSLAFYFEVANKSTNPIPQTQRGMFQFLTYYQNVRGQTILRVSTFGCGFGDFSKPDGFAAITQGFDQETASVLMSRIAVWKSEKEEPFDIMRWLDRSLIKLAQRFAQFAQDNPASFKLPLNFDLYPQFMFYLRRCPLLQVFNNSPDETTFFRYFANRETVVNTLTMIQPTLDTYSFSGPPEPVLLSAKSLQPDRILLLDTFFYLMIWSGETIAAWRKANYQEKAEYATFAELLKAPVADAESILDTRFPRPRFVVCDQHTSQARFLTSAVDPSITHATMSGHGTGEAIMTEDVNLGVFMEHLKKLAVQSS